MRMRISGGRESNGGVAGLVGTVTGFGGVGERWKNFLK